MTNQEERIFQQLEAQRNDIKDMLKGEKEGAKIQKDENAKTEEQKNWTEND